jgi:peroxiredoxin
MRNFSVVIAIILFFTSCESNEGKGEFTLQADVKNLQNQKVFLEQLYFDNKAPEVIDTADVVSGKFSVEGKATEQGLFRLRFEKQPIGYIFINDSKKISLTADANNATIEGVEINSKANKAFKSFLMAFNKRDEALGKLSVEVDSLSSIKSADSLFTQKRLQLQNDIEARKMFVIQAIDSIDNPVVCMFALGFTRDIEPKRLETIVPKLEKRFPTHNGIKGIIAKYNEMVAELNKPKPAPDAQAAAPEYNKNSIAVGLPAPEINMLDTSGTAFKLSSLKGKYVLVDFWASWCMPCRAENPNVIENYNKYKAKNFTVLGVSLDEDATAWKKAIVKDKLSFKQISDLKGWGCAATQTYGFDAIPFNVLLDPQGNIIAKDLREKNLGLKLAEVLK